MPKNNRERTGSSTIEGVQENEIPEVITDFDEAKKHLTDNYPAVAELLEELEVVTAQAQEKMAEEKLKKGGGEYLVVKGRKKVGGVIARQSPSPHVPVIGGVDPTKPIDPFCKTARANSVKKNGNSVDGILKNYMEDEALPVAVVTGSRRRSIDDTLIQASPFAEESYPGVGRNSALLEFTEKYEEKTGPISLTSEEAEICLDIVNDLKRMSPLQRKNRFTGLSLRVKQKILIFLANEKRRLSEKPIKRVSQEFTIGKSGVHCIIAPAEEEDESIQNI